jgi:hypothetical protein
VLDQHSNQDVTLFLITQVCQQFNLRNCAVRGRYNQQCLPRQKSHIRSTTYLLIFRLALPNLANQIRSALIVFLALVEVDQHLAEVQGRVGVLRFVLGGLT